MQKMNMIDMTEITSIENTGKKIMCEIIGNMVEYPPVTIKKRVKS